MTDSDVSWRLMEEVHIARHHLVVALGAVTLAAAQLEHADDIAEHIKAAIRLLPREEYL